jgi:hypothetical protein
MYERIRYPVSLTLLALLIACCVVDQSGASPETRALVNRAFTLTTGAAAAIVGAGIFIEWRDKKRRPKDGPEADYYDPPTDAH